MSDWYRDPKVLDYLKSTREWFREHRIAAAQLNLRQSPPAEKQFWLDVLEALGDTTKGAKHVD